MQIISNSFRTYGDNLVKIRIFSSITCVRGGWPSFQTSRKSVTCMLASTVVKQPASHWSHRSYHRSLRLTDPDQQPKRTWAHATALRQLHSYRARGDHPMKGTRLLPPQKSCYLPSSALLHLVPSPFDNSILLALYLKVTVQEKLESSDNYSSRGFRWVFSIS